MNVAMRQPPLSLGALRTLTALVAVFLLGGAGGYLVKGLNTPAASTQASNAVQPVAICPAGTHVAVWYTAHTWACV